MTRHDRVKPSTPAREGSKQRVQKALARAGVASRRQAELLISEGRVRVDGRRVDKQGVLVDPRRDNISVDGRRIEAEPLTYLLFHKPREVMCTMSDPLGRPSVTQYLRGVGARVVPVGRLDYQTSGVLLLTNDGELARELLHPSHGVVKEYLLKVKGAVDVAGMQRLRDRIQIAGKSTRPARVARVRADDNNTWLAVSLQEGKNRQVRRLAEHAGYRVMRLSRTSFAGLTADGLHPGQWRELSSAEVRAVRANAAPVDPESPQQVSMPSRRPARGAPRARTSGSTKRAAGKRPGKRAQGKGPQGKRGPRRSPAVLPRGEKPPAAQTRGDQPPAARTRRGKPPTAQTRGDQPPAARTRRGKPPAAQTRGDQPPAARTRGEKPAHGWSASRPGQPKRGRPGR